MPAEGVKRGRGPGHWRSAVFCHYRDAWDARERLLLSDKGAWYLKILWTLLSQTGIKSNCTFNQLGLLLTRKWENRKRPEELKDTYFFPAHLSQIKIYYDFKIL